MYDCATELITPYIVTIGFCIRFLLLHISSSFELRIHKLLNAIHKLDHHCEIKHHEAMWFRSNIISTHLTNICYVTYVSIHSSQNTAYIWTAYIYV